MTLSIEPSESTPAIAPRSASVADWYADQLMDDLFGDLERSLEEGVELLTPPPEASQPIALQSVAVPSLVLPAEVLPPPPPPKVQEPDPELIEAVADAERARQSVRLFDRLTIGAAALSLLATVGLWFLNRNAQRARQSVRLFDRLTIGAAALSLLATVGLWFLNRNAQVSVTADGPAANAPASTAASGANGGSSELTQSDTEFSAYISRSLDAIERRTTGAPAAQLPEPPAIATLPSQLPNVSALNSPSATGPAAPNPAVTPAAPAGFPLSSNLVEAIERLARLLEKNPNVAANLPPAPPAARPSPLPAASPKPAASPNPNAESGPVAAATAAPAMTYVLVGVLELGDRSSALVAVNGVTRRVNMGETVGASGWTLVEVANQAATLRREGETRSIFVGQQF